MLDMLIRNGTLIEPGGSPQVGNLLVDRGRIVAAGEAQTVDAALDINAEGCYVVPGLIDFHAHLAPLAEIGIPAEAVCFPSGVTTVVDCGSAGAATYEGHRGFLHASRLWIRCFLHVCSAGLATGRYLENPDPDRFDRRKIKRLFSDYPDELLGLKIRQGAEIVGALGLEPLEETLKLAEEIGVPVMVHCSNPPCPMDDILRLMRPGDILTHAYQDQGSTILDAVGRVLPEAWKARERGVVFDVANANIHFSFPVARAAISEGFLPDTISTDLTVRSLYKRPAVFNLPHVMSKYWNMGLSLEEVIDRCTRRPARLLGRYGEIGTLAPGARADVTVLRAVERETDFGDRLGNLLTGSRILRVQLTVKDGELMYRDMEF